MSIVSSPRSWFLPLLGLTLAWSEGAFAQGAAAEPPVPEPPPLPEPTPEPAPAAPTESVASFPDAEENTESPAPTESPEAGAAAPEPAPLPAAEPVPAPVAVVPVQATTAQPAPAPAVESSEPAPSPAPKEKSKGVHLYFGVGGTLAFGTSSSHAWASSCPSVSYGGQTLNATCAIQSPIGGAIDGQLGLRGKYFGGEGFLFGAADYSSARLNFGPSLELPRLADGTEVGRAGGGGGAGIRGFFEAGAIGVNGGLGFGAIWRGIFSNLSSTSGGFEQYVAPMLRFDAELSLLKVFQLGFLGWVEFAPDVAIHPDLSALGVPPEVEDLLGDITVFQGTQVFIGPYLGFRTP